MYVGTVVSKKDFTGQGTLTVLPAKQESTIEVKYVSFYGGGEYAGATFIPETNTQILYDRAENDPEAHYYYIGSVVNPSIDRIQKTEMHPSDKNPSLGGENKNPADSDDYKQNNQSMSYGISTPLGNHMLLRDNRNDSEDRKGVRLGSAEGRGLNLDDSSNTKKVNLYSKNQAATLKLTDLDAGDDEIGPEGALLRASRNVTVESKEGDMVFRVKDGRNLKIINSSTRSHASKNNRRSSSGNIQIVSDRGDISIVNHGNGIFIDCIGDEQQDGTTGASFQVRSNNKIQLFADNGIDLKSLGDINISGRSIILQSDVENGGTVELNPYETNKTLDQGSIGIRKRNDEIDWETFFGVFPFFFDPLWHDNYTAGPNTDIRLKQSASDFWFDLTDEGSDGTDPFGGGGHGP